MADRPPTPELIDAVQRALGRPAIEWLRPHAGLSAAQRSVVTLADGNRVFVKAAVDDDTETWLRNDYLAMAAVGDLAPEVIAWTEADGRPVLVMESLDDAHWPAGVFGAPGTSDRPVVWMPGQIERLFDALEALASVTPPRGLPPLQSVYQPQWPSIAAAPLRFVELGLAERGWLDSAMDDLLAAEAALDLRGSTLVRNDVRSDNVCFRGDRVVLVDWSDARRGCDGFDLANLVQTLPLEGGPDPQDFLPQAAPFAAWRAGEMINRASGLYGQAPPWLVRVMKRLALIDLLWAAASLGLPRAALRDWRSV